MVDRIHILGASGSGTSTLGRALSAEYGISHFDVDDYYWKVKFSDVRPREERLKLLSEDLDRSGRWVLTGSLCGWGDPLSERFDLVIFLYLPEGIRLTRLENREFERYGNEILPGGEKHEDHVEFLRWASRYDGGGMEIRSRSLHEDWLSRLKCPVLKITGDLQVPDKVKLVDDFIGKP